MEAGLLQTLAPLFKALHEQGTIKAGDRGVFSIAFEVSAGEASTTYVMNPKVILNCLPRVGV